MQPTPDFVGIYSEAASEAKKGIGRESGYFIPGGEGAGEGPLFPAFQKAESGNLYLV